jgi:hypothetical protein
MMLDNKKLSIDKAWKFLFEKHNIISNISANGFNQKNI